MSTETPTEESGPLLLAIKQVAKTLGLSEWQVRGLADDGHLPITKVRGRIYIPAGAVRDYVAEIAKTA